MVYEPKVYQPMELYVNLRSKKLWFIVWWSFDQNQGPHQAPEEFLAALAVLGAGWQSWSHFNTKYTSFEEQLSCSRSQECALGFSY